MNALVRAALVCALALAAVPGVSADALPDDERVMRAIERAVAARMGEGFAVRVADLSSRLEDGAAQIEAKPVPGTRLGRLGRFALFSVAAGRSPIRIGDAMATVVVTGPARKAARAIRRGEALTAADLVAVEQDITGIPIAELPAPSALVGAVAGRDIAEGELLTTTIVRAMPAVVSGQIVTTVAQVGDVSIEAKAVAAQRGTLGQVIRVVNPDSRRNLMGRVVGPGRVEVLREQ